MEIEKPSHQMLYKLLGSPLSCLCANLILINIIIPKNLRTELIGRTLLWPWTEQWVTLLLDRLKKHFESFGYIVTIASRWIKQNISIENINIIYRV